MKKLSNFACALAAFALTAVSCSKEEGAITPQADSAQVTFCIDVPVSAQTKAIGDGNTADCVYYEVFYGEGTDNKTTVSELDSKTTVTNGQATLTLSLVKNQKYTILFWAQKDGNGVYNTEDLTNVTVDYSAVESNKENLDAFYAAKTFDVAATSQSIEVTLTRPFAQLNIGTADAETAKALGVEIEKSKVVVSSLYNAFNVYSGAVAGTVQNNVEFRLNAIPSETLNVDANEDGTDEQYTYLALNYLLMGPDRSVVDITATFDVKSADKEDITLPFASVPVRRNYRTNIIGNLLTSSTTFNIVVDEEFAKPDYNIIDVKNDVEFEAALRQDLEEIVINLPAATKADAVQSVYSANISANVAEYYFGSEKTKSITINANGNTINFVHNNSDWNYIRCVNDDCKWVINDACLTNSKRNDGPWNRHNIRFYNAVELNNVTSDKAIAIYENATFENVKISDIHPAGNSEAYALWIVPQGQTVNINNCDFVAHSSKSGDRGITVNTQYTSEDGVNNVVLNISNTKFTTQKKAAVLYKVDKNYPYSYNAIVNWGEGNNIDNVAADPMNAVWVDEDSEDYYDNVTVNGSTKVLEGSFVAVFNADELKEAIANANNTEATSIFLKAGTYNGYFAVDGKKVTLTSNNNATIDGLVNGYNNADIKLSKLTLTNTNKTGVPVYNKYHSRADGYILGAYVANFTVEDCIFNVVATGAINHHANSNVCNLTVKNSTFNCNGETPVRARSNSTIEGCTFNNQKRYAIQISGNESLSVAQFVTFTGNRIVSPCTTSNEAIAVGVSVSGSYKCENITFNIANNTIESTKFSSLKYVYDYTTEKHKQNIVLDTWTTNGTAFEPWIESLLENDGNYASTAEFVISTAQQMVAFANMVNNEKYDFTGKTVKLGADINLAGIDWEPIGQTGATEFKGVFDGNDKVISNLTIDSEAETGDNYSSALFGWIEDHGQGITIKNVTVDGATVKGHHNCAVIAGYLIGTVSNCHVSNAKIECTMANSEANGDKAGVIVGNGAENSALISGCTAKGSTVSAGRDAGQIVGSVYKSSIVKDCSANNVTVTSNGTSTGANIRNEIIGRIVTE